MTDWFSPEEVARAGNVSLSDVRAAIAARTLRAVTTHPGAVGQWRVHARDADAWLRTVDPAWPQDGLRAARYVLRER
jgi:excisionase family DNA binding protein